MYPLASECTRTVELFGRLHQDGDLQFCAGIEGLKPWCENVINNLQVFSRLDSRSKIEPDKSVVGRLALSVAARIPHAQISIQPGQANGSMTVGRPYRNRIHFCDSREFLCKLSEQLHELTALLIIQHCFELREFSVISDLVETFPPLLLQHGNPPLIESEEGKTAELVYPVLGKPTPLFYWCFHGQNVHSQEASVDSDGFFHLIRLRITQVELEDEGDYYCCILKNHDLGFFTQTPVTKIKVIPKDRVRLKPLIHTSPKFDTFPNVQLMAKRKVALLIGNTIFENFNRLNDDTNMLQKLGEILQKHQFDVVTLQNLNSDEIFQIVEKFEQVLSPGVYAFLYLGSHGLRLHGHEYILATNASLAGLHPDLDSGLSGGHQTSDKGFPQHEARQDRRMSLRDLGKRGLISVDALTCRLNSRNPSIAVLVMDACRQDYRVDQARQWTADKTLQAVTALNFYNPSNLAVLYACQPGAAAYEGENSVLCTILIYLMQNGDQQPIVSLLDKTCAQFEKVRLSKDDPSGADDFRSRECDNDDKIEQRPDLRQPQPTQHLKTPVSVITIAGNTRRATQFDRETREHYDLPNAVWHRKLSDPVKTDETGSMIGDLWSSANTVYHSPPQCAFASTRVPKWFKAQFISTNVLRLEVDRDPRTGLPRAWFELSDMEQAWKPSRVEPDSSQPDQYRPLYGHYRAMLVRDLQRLNTEYEGNRPIEIRLHHNSSDSFRLDPSGLRCACTCSRVTINCPPIAWQMKSASITFL